MNFSLVTFTYLKAIKCGVIFNSKNVIFYGKNITVGCQKMGQMKRFSYKSEIRIKLV